MPIEARREDRILGFGVPALVSYHMWVLATEPGTSTGVAGGGNPKPSLQSAGFLSNVFLLHLPFSS